MTKKLVAAIALIYLLRQFSAASKWHAKLCDHVRLYASKLIHLDNRVTIPSNVLRAQFNQGPQVQHLAQLNHSHGCAASARATALSTCQHYAENLGLVPYSYQMSCKEQVMGLDGSRTYYWPRDIGVAPGRDPIGPEHAIIMIDVDYYVDMRDMLLQHCNVYLIYTFTPSTAGATREDYTYFFTKEKSLSTLNMYVSGGARYKHPLWDYGTDFLSVSDFWFTVTYHVERRRISDDRSIIALIPCYSSRYCGWLARWVFPQVPENCQLGRLDVVKDDMVRLDTISHAKANGKSRNLFQTSVAIAGHANSASMLTSQFEMLATYGANMRTTITPASVERLLGQLCLERDQAHILTSYLRVTSPMKPNYYMLPCHSFGAYQFARKSFEDEAVTPMRAFMTPLAMGAYVAQRSRANDERCVEKRIVELQHDAVDTPSLTPTWARYLNDFIVYVLGDAKHTLIPVDYEEVYENQSRPAQRMIFSQGTETMTVDDAPVRCFQKAEAYEETKDPRNITTLDANSKINWARYMYALSDYLKQFEWYAFGKTPKDIAARVVEIAVTASSIQTGDISRMDGSLYANARNLEHRIIMGLFHPKYASDLLKWKQTQVDRRGVTQHNVAYSTGLSRLSGSAETSVLNTLTNAAMIYMAHRHSLRGLDNDHAHHIAVQSIGLAGGDDSLTPNLPDASLVASGQALGFKVKPNTIPRGARGVNFLARTFSPMVWFGCANSMCDFKRQITKFHLTTRMDPKLPMALIAVDKLRGYVLTDVNTPIIGQLSHYLVSLFDPEFLITHTSTTVNNTDTQYFARFELSEQFPNEHGDWMLDEVVNSCPGIDIDRFNAWLAHVATLSFGDARLAVLSPPLIFDPSPPDVSCPVVINGELVPPIIEGKVKVQLPQKRGSRGRRDRKPGKKPQKA
jgi:predicted DNA-binding ribbon-helix-helix protein